MKLFSLHYARRFSVTLLLLLIMFVAAPEANSSWHLYVSASSEPTIALDPYTSVANPGEHVSVNVTINDVVDLFSYQAKLGFDRDILRAIGATEGPFLKEGTTSPLGIYFVVKIQDDVEGTFVVVMGVTLGRYPGVSGSGTLFTVDFIVQDGGISSLHLSDTIILDSNGTILTHSTADGTFHTTVPRAQFTYMPTQPVTGENITFDASSSFDPDGTIVSYEWNFGDGTTGTGMVTTHSYETEGRYKTTLQVTDDDGLSDNSAETIYPIAPLQAYIPVPYHQQINSYYCGPAALEMLFDFYGPDVPQQEIAAVARTARDGTYTSEMIRAAHFSNLSTSVGGLPESITGYTARKLGYASFECWGMTIDQLKSLIDLDYPIIVLTTWHYRVAVGYSSTRIAFQDSYWGQNYSLTYEVFDSTWDYSSHWALFVSPWKIEVFVPDNVMLGGVFNVTARVTYPSAPPFLTYQYPASFSNATVTLPSGLSLVPSETVKKPIGTGDLTAGASANVTWTVQAESLGSYAISVVAEGKVAGFAPPLPSYPEGYEYEDRIGGFSQSDVEVISPNPAEIIHEMIRTTRTWGLPKGTETSLTSNLRGVLHVLKASNEKGAIRMLTGFVKRVEALRGKKLSEEQTDYLVSEARRAVDLVQGLTSYLRVYMTILE